MALADGARAKAKVFLVVVVVVVVVVGMRTFRSWQSTFLLPSQPVRCDENGIRLCYIKKNSGGQVLSAATVRVLVCGA
jgi:hypothetical protein